MTAKMRFLGLVALLQLALCSIALAHPARQSVAFSTDPDDTLHINERGELEGELFDERGELKRNAKVMLQSRQSPGFNYGGSSESSKVSLMRS